MNIPLDSFEEHINDVILSRGLSYYKSGNVVQVEEVRAGEYEAIVEGTEDYIVEITVKNGEITSHFCDCPYDMGPVCKHVAAVIFHLQKDTLNFEVASPSSKKRPGRKPTKSKEKTQTSPRKTIAQQIDDIFEKTTFDELKNFVRQQALSDSTFRKILLLSFSHHNAHESKAMYVTEVRSIINKAAGRYKFIDWSKSIDVGTSVDRLLATAQRHIANGNYESAFIITTAVMEEMTKALEFSDDSSSYMSSTIDSAFAMVQTMAEDVVSEQFRKNLLDYCLTCYSQGLYRESDIHIEILRVASSLAVADDEVARLFEQIDREDRSINAINESQKIKYEVLLALGRHTEAEAYLRQKISNPYFRRTAIQEALRKKDYEKATALAEAGVESDKNMYGIVKEWYEFLLTIAKEQDNADTIIKYARILLFNNHTQSDEYYKILKERVPPEQWTEFVEGIVRESVERSPWIYIDFVAGIFIKEEWWERLFDLVKKSNNLAVLEKYERYIRPHLAEALADEYEKLIIKEMIPATGKKVYQTVCRFIKKIARMGYPEKADKIIAYLKNEYPRRRSMLAELQKI